MRANLIDYFKKGEVYLILRSKKKKELNVLVYEKADCKDTPSLTPKQIEREGEGGERERERERERKRERETL